MSGEFRPDDLTNLFLFARDHCDGRESVSDIGHFVAHHNERNRGIVTRSTRDWFTVARYMMSRFSPTGQKSIDLGKLPKSSKEYFNIAINRIGGKLVKEKTGIRQADAHRILNSLSDRLNMNSDGTWSVPHIITQKEFDLIKFISSYLVVQTAFSAQKLQDDFIDTLKSNGLITKDEIRLHRNKLGVIVQLYAVAIMHNCVVQVDEGTNTTLKSVLSESGIGVFATVADAAPEYPNVGVSAPIFDTKLSPTLHCHPDLQASQNWDFEIELSPQGILVPLK